VSKISQKHASLYIQESQYDIVGEYLLKAMGTILGSALTPPILDAWTAAYKQLADIMIKMEKDMLGEAGDWTGWRDFEIAKKVKEAQYITSFYLKPKDKKALPRFLPGQYVSVQTDVPDLHYLQSRQYSMSSAPNKDYYRITVKKEEAPNVGEAVAPTHPGYISTVLHDRKEVGDVLQVSFPRGDFCLDASKTIDYPVVLISAGVGLTPLVSILETLAEKKHTAPVSWIHGTRNSKLQAFGDHVRDLQEDLSNLRIRLFNHEDDKQTSYDFVGRVNLDKLDPEKELHLSNGRTEYRVCGPGSFMTDVKQTLIGMGVEEGKVKIEVFGKFTNVCSVSYTDSECSRYSFAVPGLTFL